MPTIAPRPVEVPSTTTAHAAAAPAADAASTTAPAIAAARAAMTPATSALISDAALGYRLGQTSMATALNETVRFRVEGTGPMASRSIVPDSPAAVALAQTKQGAALVGQLHTAASSIGGFEGVSDLKAFVLPKDVDSVVANSALGGTETGDAGSTSLIRSMNRSGAANSAALRTNVQAERASVTDQYAEGVAAWNQSGWIIFRPDVSRALLTSVGAYTPAAGDPVRRSGYFADIVNHVPTHEVQHSASPVSDAFYQTPGKWMEEAVAEVLSDTPGIKARTAEQTGVDPASYSAQLAHHTPIDIGWNTWHMPKATAAQKAENETAVSRNYQDSQQSMRDLLHLAGYQWGTDAGLNAMKTFLQAKPAQDLPGELAHTIGVRYGVPVSRRAELTSRIASIVDDPNGILDLKNDFSLTTPASQAASGASAATS